MRRFLLALLPLALALLAAHQSPPGSPLHQHLAPWPEAQQQLERAHVASVQLAADTAAAARQLLARLHGFARQQPDKAVKQQVQKAASTVDGGSCQLKGTVDDCCERQSGFLHGPCVRMSSYLGGGGCCES